MVHGACSLVSSFRKSKISAAFKGREARKALRARIESEGTDEQKQALKHVEERRIARSEANAMKKKKKKKVKRVKTKRSSPELKQGELQ